MLQAPSAATVVLTFKFAAPSLLRPAFVLFSIVVLCACAPTPMPMLIPCLRSWLWLWLQGSGEPFSLDYRLRFFVDGEDGRKLQISPWHGASPILPQCRAVPCRPKRAVLLSLCLAQAANTATAASKRLDRTNGWLSFLSFSSRCCRHPLSQCGTVRASRCSHAALTMGACVDDKILPHHSVLPSRQSSLQRGITTHGPQFSRN